MESLDRYAHEKLNELDGLGLKRTLVATTREDGVMAVRNGKRYVSFSCNDYLNLSHHPAVKKAAIAAVAEYGAGSSASRLVTGNHPLFGVLEAKLAQLKDAEAACVFGSGYLANAGIIPALIGDDDLLLVDELAHSCLWAGARLARCRVVTFRHNDAGHAHNLLREHRGARKHAMIVAETVYSMDGDRAPLRELYAVAQAYDTWLLSDDAHGLGLFAGDHGASKCDLQMGTLSKALGSYGGYLCASTPVIDLIKTRARTLIYSTGLPPASVAAAIAAIDIVKANPELTQKPLRQAQRFTAAAGLPLAQSPIVPLVLGEASVVLSAQRALEEEGFLVVAIRPPTVPPGTARLRFTFTAAHADAVVDRLAEIVRHQLRSSGSVGSWA